MEHLWKCPREGAVRVFVMQVISGKLTELPLWGEFGGAGWGGKLPKQSPEPPALHLGSDLGEGPLAG